MINKLLISFKRIQSDANHFFSFLILNFLLVQEIWLNIPNLTVFFNDLSDTKNWKTYFDYNSFCILVCFWGKNMFSRRYLCVFIKNVYKCDFLISYHVLIFTLRRFLLFISVWREISIFFSFLSIYFVSIMM